MNILTMITFTVSEKITTFQFLLCRTAARFYTDHYIDSHFSHKSKNEVK